MARGPSERRATPSVLDRLVDAGTRDQLEREHGKVGGPQGAAGQTLRAAVERDIENLLNTRKPPIEIPEAHGELRKSLVSYGLPDLSGVNIGSDDAREEFRQLVEDTIRTFEPRFKTVTVLLRENAEPEDRTLRLRIEGLLHADPAPEPVAFDSILEPVAHNIDVEARG